MVSLQSPRQVRLQTDKLIDKQQNNHTLILDNELGIFFFCCGVWFFSMILRIPPDCVVCINNSVLSTLLFANKAALFVTYTLNTLDIEQIKQCSICLHYSLVQL